MKLVAEVDMKEAARAGLLGLGSKPLTSDNIEKHLTDFGLDPEFGVHSRIRGLSGAFQLPSTLCKRYTSGSMGWGSRLFLPRCLARVLFQACEVRCTHQQGLLPPTVSGKRCVFPLGWGHGHRSLPPNSSQCGTLASICSLVLWGVDSTECRDRRVKAARCAVSKV